MAAKMAAPPSRGVGFLAQRSRRRRVTRPIGGARGSHFGSQDEHGNKADNNRENVGHRSDGARACTGFWEGRETAGRGLDQ